MITSLIKHLFLQNVQQFENTNNLCQSSRIIICSTCCTSCSSNQSSKNTIQAIVEQQYLIKSDLSALITENPLYKDQILPFHIKDLSLQIFQVCFFSFSLQYQLKQTRRMNYEFTLIQQNASSKSVEEQLTAPLLVIPIRNKKNSNTLQGDSCRKSKKKHWKPQQNDRYIQFLKNHIDLFEKDREDKRLMKINILMSKHVRSKNSTQCRSHHQKMLIHYKTIENIIASLSSDSCSEQLYDEDLVGQNLYDFARSSQSEEFVEEIEPQIQVERSNDVFQVIDNNCWGYTNGLSLENLLF